jgi:stage III sporulation protein AH
MNKKQAGIIVTLLALIVCAGLLAVRVNSPLNEGMQEVWTLNNKNDSTEKSTSDFLVSTKMERDNNQASVITGLQTVMNNDKLSQEQRDSASQKFTMLNLAQDQEMKIEQSLKSKGFESVCFVENNNEKARVVVQAKELSAEQRKTIQDAIMSVAKYKDMEVQLKQ